jgi:hypothetical protein
MKTKMDKNKKIGKDVTKMTKTQMKKREEIKRKIRYKDEKDGITMERKKKQKMTKGRKTNGKERRKKE